MAARIVYDELMEHGFYVIKSEHPVSNARGGIRRGVSIDRRWWPRAELKPSALRSGARGSFAQTTRSPPSAEGAMPQTIAFRHGLVPELTIGMVTNRWPG